MNLKINIYYNNKMSNKAIARKRINKDIKEIKNNPLEGIGIAHQ